MRKGSRRTLTCAALPFLLAAPGRPAEALSGRERLAGQRSPPTVEYRLRVALDPARRRLEGSERLVWRNHTNDSVGELRFHLYWNAFKNAQSTFYRESGRTARLERTFATPDDWGSIDVLSIRDARGRELRPGARFAHPDGNDPSDETVLAVPLPDAVPPGGDAVLEIRFRSRLPRLYARAGAVREFHFVGQWFPKLGVYEAAGTRGRAAGGWNCHAFHANSEFYADFGDYDVAFTVPSRYAVGATGVEASRTASGGRTTHRYLARNVHDFAWTADPRFQVIEFRFDPERDVPEGWRDRAAAELGIAAAGLALPGIGVRLLLQPEHAGARERYVRSVKEAIAFFGLWFGPYPYPNLTVVDPPEDGLGAAGMEYPTLFTGVAPWPLLHWPLDKVRLTEAAVIHEYGHQYWYGIVASNEFEEPWLDEGVNSDSEYRAMSLAYGPRDAVELPGGIGSDSLSVAHAEYAALPNLDPIRRFAWRFASSTAYGVNSYAKAGLLLAQLRSDLGAGPFARAQREYFQQWAFRHPTTDDFFDVFERVSGRSLAAYRSLAVEGRGRLDWSVVSASTRRAAGPERRSAPSSRAAPRESVVLFGNLGDWPHGVGGRAVFTDGAVVDRQLPPGAAWVRWRLRYRAPLAWAAADPERRNAWEWNRVNDSRVLNPGKGPARTGGWRAAVRTLGWAAHVVGLFVQALGALG